jgi:hypothetical protein
MDYEVFEVLIHSGSITKECHSMIQGPTLSHKMWSPWHLFRARAHSWLPVLKQITTAPIELATAPIVLRHLCNKKISTSKAWATKAQQDCPINVATNNRLLVCKASWESSILCQTCAKSESLFYVLALFQTFLKKGASYSNHTRVAKNSVY